MRRFVFAVLLLLLTAATAAELVRVEVGVPGPGFNPADLHTYKIARETRLFHGDDREIVFVTYWRFSAADVGPQAFEMYLLPPRGEVERAGYSFSVPASWAGKVKPTFWHFNLNPTKARQQAGKWTVYFLFNGELKGKTSFELSP
jgi:hypothetical protein